MQAFYIAILLVPYLIPSTPVVLLPVNANDRYSASGIRLTDIGEFGMIRAARPGIREHFHTGIDIRRPTNNYQDEPVYAIAPGLVISKRTDGPYAQLIVEHALDKERIWTVYEHIAGIKVSTGDIVNPFQPVGRFMNREELSSYGWQFDHFHFEVLREKPLRLQPDPAKPERFFTSYTLICHKPDELKKYFLNPNEFFREKLSRF